MNETKQTHTKVKQGKLDTQTIASGVCKIMKKAFIKCKYSRFEYIPNLLLTCICATALSISHNV
jgi:hypothetical protein